MHTLALRPASAPWGTVIISILQKEKLRPHGSHTHLISHQPGIQTQISSISRLNVPALPLTHKGDEESPRSSLGLSFPTLLTTARPPRSQSNMGFQHQLPLHSRTSHSSRTPPAMLWCRPPACPARCKWWLGPPTPGSHPSSEHSAFWKNDPILLAHRCSQLPQATSSCLSLQTMPWAQAGAPAPRLTLPHTKEHTLSLPQPFGTRHLLPFWNLCQAEQGRAGLQPQRPRAPECPLDPPGSAQVAWETISGHLRRLGFLALF